MPAAYRLRLASFSLVFLAVLATASCSEGDKSPGGTDVAPANADSRPTSRPDAPATSRDGMKPFADAAIDDYRRELVELAFSAVSKFPTMPHEKNRSREQQDVVETCLELGLVKTAHEYAVRITNWRRGLALALVARHCVDNGIDTDLEKMLESALRVAQKMHQDESEQKWRTDRVRANVAAVFLLMGREDLAQPIGMGLEASEVRPIAEVKARKLDPALYDQHLASIEPIVKNGEFEAMKLAFEICIRFHEQFYSDEKKRDAMAESVLENTSNIPAELAVKMRVDLAENAIGHGDHAKAREYLELARTEFGRFKWQNEALVGLSAMIGDGLRRAGAEEEALKVLRRAHSDYEANRAATIDMFRARSLRPLAEAFVKAGRLQEARLVYAKVIEEGMVNANARPQAIDLSATCRSMAVNEFEPDADTLTRLHQIHDGLDEQWKR